LLSIVEQQRRVATDLLALHDKGGFCKLNQVLDVLLEDVHGLAEDGSFHDVVLLLPVVLLVLVLLEGLQEEHVDKDVVEQLIARVDDIVIDRQILQIKQLLSLHDT
jgi:hypothetical protein